MPYIPFNKIKQGGGIQTAIPSGYIPFGKSVQPVKSIGEMNLGLPEIGGMKTTTPTIIPQQPSTSTIPIKETLKYLTPQTISEAGGKVISAIGQSAIGQFGKTIGQGIARSFIAVGTELREQLLVPKAERKLFGEATYTPQNEVEKKIFGTDKPISFKTIGDETLMVGGEDFKNKWGEYALPVGILIAGLDVIPSMGGGKKQLLNQAAKVISKTDDVVKIAKTLKTVIGGSDEVIEFLAKSLKMVNKEDDVLKIIQQAGKAKQAIPIVQKAIKEIVEEVPKITPENTIQKLINAIDEAVPLRGEQAKLYSQEMAKRTARVAAMGEKVVGEKGFFAQLGQLKGELPKKTFEAIRNQFSQKEADLLFNTIEQLKTLLPLEKVATKGGLAKLLNGAVPTKGEIELLREVFPKDLIDSILARRPILEKIGEITGELINVPRTMMATADLSAPLRQGIFMVGRPQRFLQAFGDMFKYAFSEKAYQGGMEAIKARPTYLKMRQAGLSLTEIGGELAKREEIFMGAYAEKIPLWGRVVRASNRAYTGFLNKLRADVFDDILKQAKNVGRDADDNLLKSVANFVNAGTGRGNIGQLQKIAPVLNATFFSPRLMASRLNLLNPYFYIKLDPLVRKEAMKTLFADVAIFGTIYGLWEINGGEVGLDWRSADFGKIKIGNTRYDILGGFSQYFRLAGQLITGEIISSTTGRTITLGEGYKPLTKQEIITRFFENKTSPIASFIIGLLKGQTATGEDVDVPAEVISRFIPMVVQDIYDLSQEKGAEGILMGLPGIFGVGVQTYGKQELTFGESKLGEPTAQIRPVPELAEKIRELVIGQLPLGTSKSFSIEAYFDQLSNLSREEAREIFDKITEANPELAKKISDVVKERELGITVKDKDLKSKGVASGDRALAIKKELDKLKTKEEKKALWDDYVKKGVITKDVSKQLLKLLR